MMTANRLLIIPFFALVFLVQSSIGGFYDEMKKFPCYSRKYQRRRFFCENEFYLSFRDRPFQSCSDKATDLAKCFDNVNEECLSQANPKSLMYRVYKRVNKKKDHKEVKKDYCHNAGLVVPFISARASRNLGCTLDFYVGKAACIKDFQRKWRHNRSNSLLCNEYYSMEICIERQMNVHCTAEAMKRMKDYKSDFLSKLHLDLNPFCIHAKS